MSGIDAWRAEAGRRRELAAERGSPPGVRVKRPRRALPGRRWGTGEARALLLHGSASSSATWWRVGPALAELGYAVTALDLPGHGSDPALEAPLTPAAAAAHVRGALHDEHFALVVGHSFGAATSIALLATTPELAERVVLEEPSGPSSVDWAADAAAVRRDAAEARRDPEAAFARIRAGHPRWSDEDCRHAACDLAACAAEDVAAGYERGEWPLPDESLSPPLLLLLAPDAPGRNRGEDATVLRGRDREVATRAADEVRVLDGGHYLHRDDCDGWMAAVRAFAPAPGGPAGPGREPVGG